MNPEGTQTAVRVEALLDLHAVAADRDFNFQVAEKFKNSYVFLIPLYLWRIKKENPRFADGIEAYLT